MPAVIISLRAWALQLAPGFWELVTSSAPVCWGPGASPFPPSRLAVFSLLATSIIHIKVARVARLTNFLKISENIFFIKPPGQRPVFGIREVEAQKNPKEIPRRLILFIVFIVRDDFDVVPTRSKHHRQSRRDKPCDFIHEKNLATLYSPCGTNNRAFIHQKVCAPKKRALTTRDWLCCLRCMTIRACHFVSFLKNLLTDFP